MTYANFTDSVQRTADTFKEGIMAEPEEVRIDLLTEELATSTAVLIDLGFALNETLDLIAVARPELSQLIGKAIAARMCDETHGYLWDLLGAE